MKASTTGAVSGCVVWLIVFGVLNLCLVPLAFIIGGITSGTSLAAQAVGPVMCPSETTATIKSYATTTINDNGVSVPATAFVLHCVDASGRTIKEDPVVFAFLWEGAMAAAALLLAAALSFLLAAPAGILMGKLVATRRRNPETRSR